MHLHPGLERAMYGYLAEKSQSVQMFIATHSTNFIDVSMAQNVYLIGRAPGRVSIIEPVISQDDILRIPDEIGLRPSTVFMFDKLLFVEGATDEAILREFARKLDVDLASVNAGFVQMGGASKFAHYAAEATIELLSRRRIKMLFVIDRDEKDDSDIARMVGRLGERATILALKRREMENYLLVPSAIVELIREKKNLSKDSDRLPSESNIASDIKAVSAAMKDRVLDLRVRRQLIGPLYLDNLADENEKRLNVALDQINERLSKLSARTDEIAKQLDKEWPSRSAEIAPGSEVLDGVLTKYGLRYRKEVDAARLAAAMTKDDIDQEIVTTLRRL